MGKFLSLTGVIGSGKTSIGEDLSRILEIKYFYAGGLMRKFAEENRQTIELFQETIDGTGNIFDKHVDDKLVSFIADNEQGIVDARTGPHFIRTTLRPEEYLIIYLDCNPSESARRRLAGDLKSQGVDSSELTNQQISELLETKKTQCLERERQELERFKKLYRYDKSLEGTNPLNYVINTTLLTQKQVFEKTLKVAAEFFGKEHLLVSNDVKELVT